MESHSAAAPCCVGVLLFGQYHGQRSQLGLSDALKRYNQINQIKGAKSNQPQRSQRNRITSVIFIYPNRDLITCEIWSLAKLCSAHPKLKSLLRLCPTPCFSVVVVITTAVVTRKESSRLHRISSFHFNIKTYLICHKSKLLLCTFIAKLCAHIYYGIILYRL